MTQDIWFLVLISEIYAQSRLDGAIITFGKQILLPMNRESLKDGSFVIGFRVSMVRKS